MTRRRIDYTLMLVTDPGLTAARGLVWTVLEAVAGGVTVVQLRDKAAEDAALAALARTLRAALAPLGVPLIVNDRIAVAKAAGLAGVHLGEADESPLRARAELGPDAVIGLSITDPARCAAVPLDTIDYVGAGPVFPTRTKADAAPATGLAGLSEIRRRIPLPVVAIGGIDAGNAAAVRASGVDGLAVVSAICTAPSPRAAAAALRG